MPDIFRGSQLTIIGRYRNPIDMNFVRLTLTGKSGGSERKFSTTIFILPERRSE